MANCTSEDVRKIIDTGLGDPDIEVLIVLADEEITNRGILLNRTLVSMLFTASYIALRNPDSKGVGEYQESDTPGKWRALAEKVILQPPQAPIVKATKYSVITET